MAFKISTVTNILGDSQPAGRIENIANVHAAVQKYRRITLRELSMDEIISYSRIQSILTDDLGIRRVTAKFVSKGSPHHQHQKSNVSAAQHYFENGHNRRRIVEL